MHYILHGPNDVDRDERVKELASELEPGGFGTTRVDAAEADAGDLAAALNSPPFFGGCRVVVIEHLFSGGSSRLNWEGAEPLLLDCPKSTAAIIVHSDKIPSNRRVHRLAREHGWQVEEFPIPRGSALIQWTLDRAAREGVTLERPAAQRLLELLYPTAWQAESKWHEVPIQMRLIATEIAKLASAAIDGTITRQIVEELVADRSGVTAFRLTDETFEGRVAPALAELDQVLASGDPPERVVGQLAHHAVVLEASRVADSFGVDSAASASGISAGQIKATMGRKTGWRKPGAQVSAAEALRRAEWLVKTGRSPRTDAVIVPLVGEIADAFRIAPQESPQRGR